MQCIIIIPPHVVKRSACMVNKNKNISLLLSKERLEWNETYFTWIRNDFHIHQIFVFIANCCRPRLRCRENCPSFMYFWQIAAMAACFAFIPNCCPQKICQSIRRQVGSTLFKSRLVHFLPKMPTLHGATPAVKSKHRQTYFPIKILLFRQFLIFLKQLVPLDCQHKREPIALLRCLGFV